MIQYPLYELFIYGMLFGFSLPFAVACGERVLEALGWKRSLRNDLDRLATTTAEAVAKLDADIDDLWEEVFKEEKNDNVPNQVHKL